MSKNFIIQYLICVLQIAALITSAFLFCWLYWKAMNWFGPTRVLVIFESLCVLGSAYLCAKFKIKRAAGRGE